VKYPIAARHRVPQAVGCYPLIFGCIDEENGICLHNCFNVVRRVESPADQYTLASKEIHYIAWHSTPFGFPAA
jgi:hypothetical protein